MAPFRGKFSRVALGSPFEWSLARRAAVATVGSACLAGAVILATDEPANSVGMRAARLAALAPLLSCVGVFGVFAHARSRGELVSLEALGMAPWEAARGAAMAGWAFGALGLIVLALPSVDPESLFPRFLPPIDWVLDASRSAARSAVATVTADGGIEIGARTAARVAEGPTRWAAVACLAPFAIGTPAWAVTPMTAQRRVASVGAAAALLVVVLHAIAAGRINAGFGPLASTPLYAALMIARRGRGR